jgi:serine/threonine protein kinase
MEWYNSQRLIICTNKVGKPINLNQTNAEAIKELYDSLQFFHKITGYIHKDIYYNNILQSEENKLFLNDFGLADIKDELSPIEGNPFFASDRVLECKETQFKYE